MSTEQQLEHHQQHIDRLESENRFLRQIIIGFMVLFCLIVIVYAVQTLFYYKQLYANPTTSQQTSMAVTTATAFIV